MDYQRVIITDKVARKAPSSAGWEIADDVPPGHLVLRISPKGVRSWVVFWRDAATNKQKRKVIGYYPETSIKAARDLVKTRLAAITTTGAPPKDPTVQVAFDEFIAAQERRLRKATLANMRSTFKLHVLPKWKGKRLSEIDSVDLNRLVNAALEKKRVGVAREIRKYVTRLWSWSRSFGLTKTVFEIDEGLTNELQYPDEHGTPLDDKTLRELWKRSEKLSVTYRTFYRLLALTGARPFEVGEAKWPEFQDDAINLSKARGKNGMAYSVVLGKKAKELVGAVEGLHDVYMFPNIRESGPINGHSKIGTALFKGLAHTTYDLRRTWATRVEGHTMNPTLVNRALNQGKSKADRTYQRHEWAPKIRETMDWWADELQRILDADA